MAAVTALMTAFYMFRLLWLTFFGASAPDAAITVSGVTVNPDGTSLTANVSIASTAATGPRTIRVTGPGGNSTAVPTNANVFTVVP